GVGAGGVPAELGGAERAPGDAVAGVVEAAEGALQALDVGEQVLFGDRHVLHDDLASGRGAQGKFSFDLRGRQALHALLQDEAADLAGVVLGPDDEDVGDRRIGDPHLAALEDVAAVHLAGARPHAGGIRAGVGLGQAEAADPFALRQLRQVLLSLRLGAVGMDRVHDEARLHAHGRAVAAVDALDFAGDEAVADIVHAGAAIALDGRAEQAELAQLVHDRAV